MDKMYRLPERAFQKGNPKQQWISLQLIKIMLIMFQTLLMGWKMMYEVNGELFVSNIHKAPNGAT